MFDPARLRIAIQASGRLSEPSCRLLRKCGLRFSQNGRKLLAHVENHPIDCLFVRDDDIPGLVMDGICDLGIVGENVLAESRLERLAFSQPSDFANLLRLDFGECRLSIAVPEEFPYENLRNLEGLRIATTYPRLLQSFAKENGLSIELCQLKGSVEVAPRLGLADAICDLVSSGATLESNGLKEVEVIMESRACLIQSRIPMNHNKQQMIDMLLRRIQGVLSARERKYIMLHSPKHCLSQVIGLLPGAENPTVLPLAERDDMVAVHAVSSENLFWTTMEALKQLGASSILVLPIEKMLE